MEAVILLLILIPFITAILIFPFTAKNPKARDSVLYIVSIIMFLLSLVLLKYTPVTVHLPLFGEMGLNFMTGSLRRVFIILTAFMWLACSQATPEYFRSYKHITRFYVFFMLTYGAIMGVFFSADLFTMFVFFEIMSITSYAWVVQTEMAEAIYASKTYLYISVIGGMVMLMGLFLIYANTGSMFWEDIAAADMSYPVRLASGLCILCGFGIKAGMFPLHIWQSNTYVVSPPPATALLSGILSKSGVFGIILISQNLFAHDKNWGNMLLILSVLTMLIGAIRAIFSTHMRRTLAMSSMSQIGFILFGVAMYTLLSEDVEVVTAGITLHILNHSLIKLTLFLAAGVAYRCVGSTDFSKIRGFGKGKPLFMFIFLMCACSLAGIPGFSGYISKTLLHESIVDYAAIMQATTGSGLFYKVIEWLFLIAGGCTFAYMGKLFLVLFVAKPSKEMPEKATKKKYMGPATTIILTVCAALMPILGITVHSTMERIYRMSSTFYGEYSSVNISYYSNLDNIKGSLTSIGIGIVLLIIMTKVFTKKTEDDFDFRNLWPDKLYLDVFFYRPVLRFLCFIGAIIGRVLEAIGTGILYGIINLIFLGAKSKVTPGENRYFGKYGKAKVRHIADESFSSDLLLAGLGISAIVIYAVVSLLI